METETWPSSLLPPKLFVMEDLHRFSTWGKHGQEYGALSPLSFQAKTAILTQEGQVSDIITPHPLLQQHVSEAIVQADTAPRMQSPGPHAALTCRAEVCISHSRLWVLGLQSPCLPANYRTETFTQGNKARRTRDYQTSPTSVLCQRGQQRTSVLISQALVQGLC